MGCVSLGMGRVAARAYLRLGSLVWLGGALLVNVAPCSERVRHVGSRNGGCEAMSTSQAGTQLGAVLQQCLLNPIESAHLAPRL